MNNEPVIDRISKNETADLFRRQKEYTYRLAQTTPRERKAKLRRMLEYLNRHAEKIEQATFQDLRKPAPEARISELLTLTTELKYHIKHLDKWMKPQRVSTPLVAIGTDGYIRYEPKGTSLIISPWNYPINLAIKPLIYAVSAGCTAIIKPSEFAPRSADFIREMVRNLFLPEEVSVVEGDREAAECLLELPFDHIYFTGSPNTARKVMAAASKHLSSVSLELGGKSPSIIDQTADLASTARNIAWAKLINSGQSCIAPDYILVHKNVEGPFLEELKKAFQSMYDPKGEGVHRSADYGRIINSHHFDRLKSLYEDALAKGAKTVTGGGSNRDDLYIEPTVLVNIQMSMEMMKEEIFGPLLPVLTFESLELAVKTVNSMEKPLALYMHSRNPENIRYVLSHTSSGNALVNEVLLQFQHPEIPFGGIGNSGMGRANGFYGFREFSNPKGIIERKYGTMRFLHPPYNERTARILNWLQRLM